MAIEQLKDTRGRITGRNAASLKYDVLSALGAHGCAGDKHLQRLVLRFITLIVARYNWQTGELCVGQREIATLWSVDERTVKRDMARLRELGWLRVKQPAARGRVAVLALEIPVILGGTSGDWAKIGPDYLARMAPSEAPDETAEAPKPEGNVISFPAPPRAEGDQLWPRMREVLHRESPELYAAWFAGLEAEPGPGGHWRLRAPSRFHASFIATHHLARLEALMRRLDPGVSGVSLCS